MLGNLERLETCFFDYWCEIEKPGINYCGHYLQHFCPTTKKGICQEATTKVLESRTRYCILATFNLMSSDARYPSGNTHWISHIWQLQNGQDCEMYISILWYSGKILWATFMRLDLDYYQGKTFYFTAYSLSGKCEVLAG